MDKELNKELKSVWGDIFGLCLTGVTWLVAPFWLSLPLTAYMVSNCGRNKKSRDEKENHAWEESKRIANELASPKIDPRPQGMPDEFFPYKDCIVEVFREPCGTIARVINSDGKDIGKNYESIPSAVSEIEEYTPEPSAPREQGIRNVRIVR